jgi:hypothetical protein
MGAPWNGGERSSEGVAICPVPNTHLGVGRESDIEEGFNSLRSHLMSALKQGAESSERLEVRPFIALLTPKTRSCYIL